MEILSITKTNRQWPQDMIMPATARHHTSVYYGLAEAKIKVLVNDLLPQIEIVNRIIEWLKSELQRMSPKRYAKNEPIYQLVLQNDIGQMVNKIYSQYVIHADKEDVNMTRNHGYGWSD